ncbi:Toll/interleukin-1 receptor (TIR) domain [Trinorchestia longiramus]|nr:Toll/interleukin-1 receptor (TIR) domain [Trinorchestia longiramus]
MAGMASSSDYAKWLRYKKDFGIEVDEKSPQFAEWMNIFLLMMQITENEFKCNIAASLRPQVWDCCIVCSDAADDLAVAGEFRDNLEKGGYFACLLQNVPPGGHLLNEARKMLEHSTVIFILCTPSLLLDRGIAKMAFQDCLALQWNNVSGSKKIVPVSVPSSDPAGQCLSEARASRAKEDALVRTSPKRDVPLGFYPFRRIWLTKPEAYMEQVSLCISEDEQQQVRDTRQLHAETQRLVQERQRRDSLKRAVEEAVKLFQCPPSTSTYRQINSLISSTMRAPNHQANKAGPDDGVGDLVRDLLTGNLGPDMTPQQLVTLKDCREVSVGTALHFHIEDSTTR